MPSNSHYHSVGIAVLWAGKGNVTYVDIESPNISSGYEYYTGSRNEYMKSKRIVRTGLTSKKVYDVSNETGLFHAGAKYWKNDHDTVFISWFDSSLFWKGKYMLYPGYTIQAGAVSTVGRFITLLRTGNTHNFVFRKTTVIEATTGLVAGTANSHLFTTDSLGVGSIPSVYAAAFLTAQAAIDIQGELAQGTVHTDILILLEAFNDTRRLSKIVFEEDADGNIIHTITLLLLEDVKIETTLTSTVTDTNDYTAINVPSTHTNISDATSAVTPINTYKIVSVQIDKDKVWLLRGKHTGHTATYHENYSNIQSGSADPYGDYEKSTDITRSHNMNANYSSLLEIWNVDVVNNTIALSNMGQLINTFTVIDTFDHSLHSQTASDGSGFYPGAGGVIASYSSSSTYLRRVDWVYNHIIFADPVNEILIVEKVHLISINDASIAYPSQGITETEDKTVNKKFIAIEKGVQTVLNDSDIEIIYITYAPDGMAVMDGGFQDYSIKYNYDSMLIYSSTTPVLVIAGGKHALPSIVTRGAFDGKLGLAIPVEDKGGLIFKVKDNKIVEKAWLDPEKSIIKEFISFNETRTYYITLTQVTGTLTEPAPP